MSFRKFSRAFILNKNYMSDAIAMSRFQERKSVIFASIVGISFLMSMTHTKLNKKHSEV